MGKKLTNLAYGIFLAGAITTSAELLYCTSQMAYLGVREIIAEKPLTLEESGRIGDRALAAFSLFPFSILLTVAGGATYFSSRNSKRGKLIKMVRNSQSED